MKSSCDVVLTPDEVDDKGGLNWTSAQTLSSGEPLKRFACEQTDALSGRETVARGCRTAKRRTAVLRFVRQPTARGRTGRLSQIGSCLMAASHNAHSETAQIHSTYANA